MAKFPTYCLNEFNSKIKICSTNNDNSGYNQVDRVRQHIVQFTEFSKITTKPVAVYSGTNELNITTHIFILRYKFNFKKIDTSYVILFNKNVYNILQIENKDEKNIYLVLYAKLNGNIGYPIND